MTSLWRAVDAATLALSREQCTNQSHHDDALTVIAAFFEAWGGTMAHSSGRSVSVISPQNRAIVAKELRAMKGVEEPSRG
jgi:hypothetical protein